MSRSLTSSKRHFSAIHQTLAKLLKIATPKNAQKEKSLMAFSKKTPFDCQQLAIDHVIEGFKKVDRGQLIMPCGSGKTLVALWIHEQLNPQYTLVVFPSLALLRQTKNEWSANRKHPLSYLCVCSEQDIDSEDDGIQMQLSEIDGNVTTHPEVIRFFLQNQSQAIVFSTYQSLKSVAAAIQGTDIQFSLAICDEAHKTAGTQEGLYSLIHDNVALPIQKRLYMTATPRVVSQNMKTRLNRDGLSYIADMNDPKIFGPVLHQMSFKDAIDQGILVDYNIVAIGVTDLEIQSLIKEHRFTQKGVKIEEIANNYALNRFMEQYNTSSVISFHSSIKKAREFKKRHQKLFKEVKAFHVNGTQTTRKRHEILNKFAQFHRSIVSNARCLTEGVDIPAVDAVYFCDPKSSNIDIVQAAGRALRRADHRDKTMGYIVIPLFHRQEDDLESIIENGGFSNIIHIMRSLSNHDDRITQEIKRQRNVMKEERGSPDSLTTLQSNPGVKFIEINWIMESFKERLFTELINNFKIPFLEFKQARNFARSLGLDSRNAWNQYVKNGQKPNDIPVDPAGLYKHKGWISWGDWLGTGRITHRLKKLREFEQARVFTHTLGLKSHKEWDLYCRSGQKPEDIPVDPRKAYKNKGWVSMGDWLGTGKVFILQQYREFKEARSFIRSLTLNSRIEWDQYARSGQKPIDIPAIPWGVYKTKGWISLGDWLGTKRVSSRHRQYREFEQARAFVQTLGLKSKKEWLKYARSGQKPEDIPINPSITCKHKGWISWGDWLGTGRVALKYK